MSELNVDKILSSTGSGAPNFPKGATVTGILTATSFDGTVTGTAELAEGLTGTPDITVRNVVAAAGTFSGDLQVQGTVTYEDVTNVDSVGVITAQQGIDVTSGDITVSSGIVTASGGFNIGISSANTVITEGPIKTLNFVGTGNTFLVDGTTVDISISGGGGGSDGNGPFSQFDTWLFGGS